MKTNNIDHCSRLCHSLSSAALGKTLGYGAMSNSVHEGFEALKESVKDYTPEYAEKICGVLKEDIVKAARIYSSNNELTGSEFLEPISKTPEYKICPVKLI